MPTDSIEWPRNLNSANRKIYINRTKNEHWWIESIAYCACLPTNWHPCFSFAWELSLHGITFDSPLFWNVGFGLPQVVHIQHPSLSRVIAFQLKMVCLVWFVGNDLVSTIAKHKYSAIIPERQVTVSNATRKHTSSSIAARTEDVELLGVRSHGRARRFIGTPSANIYVSRVTGTAHPLSRW